MEFRQANPPAPAPLLPWPGPVSFFNRKMDLQGSGNCLYDLRGKLINAKPHCLCSHPCLFFLGYEFPFPLSQSGWMLVTLTKLVSKETLLSWEHLLISTV